MLTIALALIATAQAAPPDGGGYGAAWTGGARGALGWDGVGQTPTMRRQKLRQAIRLRARLDALLAQDGGTLTPEHEAAVRREAHWILYGR